MRQGASTGAAQPDDQGRRRGVRRARGGGAASAEHPVALRPASGQHRADAGRRGREGGAGGRTRDQLRGRGQVRNGERRRRRSQ